LSPALLDGQPAVPIAQRPLLAIETISPEYLTALQIRLISGRQFGARDQQNASRVAIVNEALVRRFWPNETPIGKRMYLGRMKGATEVVGVVADVKNVGITDNTMPEVYLPLAQLPWSSVNLLVRTSVDPHLLVAAIRQRITAADRDQPVTSIQTLDELRSASMLDRRFTLSVLGFFSVAALLLAAAGIYAVIACSIRHRTQELGIRMALGAVPADLLWSVVRRAVVCTSAGIAAGIAGSLLLTRFISALLYDVRATDPVTFAAGTLLFALIAVVATYLPARSAIRMDPMAALRFE
jgi:putative ABC transport system permease protein